MRLMDERKENDGEREGLLTKIGEKIESVKG